LLSHLLKKKPNERINATNALHHPYFKGVKFEEPKKIIEEPIDKTVSDNLQISTNGYPNCESPLLTTANKKRKLDKSMKKDSCVEFHMGK
jgi:serine/threonine protein kinase